MVQPSGSPVAGKGGPSFGKGAGVTIGRGNGRAGTGFGGNPAGGKPNGRDCGGIPTGGNPRGTVAGAGDGICND